MLLREFNEEREHGDLNSCALTSSQSRGRVHPEEPDRFRTIYLRDRDRIIHSSAFRRLEYKTQVFINNEGDYYRTRLTHTLEVSQIARSVAYTLRFNEGFVEALSLAHDLGHPPFGHTGEAVLDSLMLPQGGFEHNRQALRVVDTLEIKYPIFKGLNLSHELREAILKHGHGLENIHCQDFRFDLKPYLEAQIVNIADQIAYQHHDLDDGLEANILLEEDLLEMELWKRAAEKVKARYPRLHGRIRQMQIVNTIVKLLIGDLISRSHKRLAPFDGRDAASMRQLDENVIDFSPSMVNQMKELQNLLNEKFYGHHRLARVRVRSELILRKLFTLYLENPKMLPPDFRDLVSQVGQERVVCDYIACMTDRFALEEWNRFQR